MTYGFCVAAGLWPEAWMAGTKKSGRTISRKRHHGKVAMCLSPEATGVKGIMLRSVDD
jgi:hypothetical protein